MYKLIKQYEKKNKIIEQIQKNLSRTPTKHSSTGHKQRVSPSPTNINFPALYITNEYSARTNHKSLETKLSSQILKLDKQTKNKVDAAQTANWTKTIDLKSRQTLQQSFLITNMAKNLISSLQQYSHQRLKQGHQTIPKNYDFESNSKVMSQYQSLKKRHLIEGYPVQLQNGYQSEWIKQHRKVKRRVKAQKRRPQSYIENAKQKDEKQRIRYFEAPLMISKKNKAKSIRVCSPWQLGGENVQDEEVLDFGI